MTRRCFRWWLCALASLGCVVGPARAQLEPDVPVIAFDGTEVFTYLLHARQFTPVASLHALSDLNPHESMLIVFGDYKALQRPGSAIVGLRRFHDRGGAVLFASDSPGMVRDWGLEIPADTVEQDKDSAYRNNFKCPLIQSLRPIRPTAFHGLTRGLALNRPRYFEQQGTAPLRSLANFPPGCYSAEILRFRLFSEAPAVFIAGGSERNAGRSIFIPGHGLFTNGMLLQQDNDNFEFAVNCLRWLSEGPNAANRKHVLFLVDGTAVESFDVSLKAPPLPLPPIPVPTIQLVNELLHGLEREGFVVRLLRDNFDVRVAARWTLVVLTVVLLVVGAKKLSELRHRPEASSALLLGPYAPPDRTPVLVKQRAQSGVRGGALWDDARALARQWFTEMADMPATAWDRDHAARPDIEAIGGWWQRSRLTRAADRVWQLAVQTTPTPFSWRELVRLTATLQSLTQAVHEGRLIVNVGQAFQPDARSTTSGWKA